MDFFQNGKSFRCNIIPDDTYGAPWENADCYGIVSKWERRDKRPCERILCKDGPYLRFYDVAESTKKALRDGWGGTLRFWRKYDKATNCSARRIRRF